MALEEYEVYLMGDRSPLSYEVHEGSFGGYRATGLAVVNAVSIKQAYYFCHTKKLAPHTLGFGIISMTFWDSMEIERKTYTHQELWELMKK